MASLLERVTPGPWRNNGRLGFGHHITSDRESPGGQIAVAYGESNPDGLYNAELIALAPDHALLLRALKLRKAELDPRADADAHVLLTDASVAGGTLYVTEYDACGIPALTPELREALRRAIGLETK